jgi:hypothetical protein
MASSVINIFAVDEILCALKFEGKNTIGNPQVWEFPSVSLEPGKSISLLSDGWQELPVSGEVFLQEESGGTQSFGTITMADGGTAPNTSNYSIGKGILYIDLSQTFSGKTGWIDLGNVTAIDFAIKVTKLDHFSSRSGVKTKDQSVITERAATISFTMDELTAQNLSLAVMGDIT